MNLNEGMSDDSLAFFRPWKYVTIILIPSEEVIVINFHDCVFWSESVGMVLTQGTHLTYDLPSAFNSIAQRDDIGKIVEEVQYICSKRWWCTNQVHSLPQWSCIPCHTSAQFWHYGPIWMLTTLGQVDVQEKCIGNEVRGDGTDTPIYRAMARG